MANQDRPAPPQTRLEVVCTETLGEAMLRLTFTGEIAERFAPNGATDRYIKFAFIPAGSTVVPPFDIRALRAELPAEELPRIRTYTVRSVDLEANTIAVDFVLHGDDGIAGPWAAQAKPGDVIYAGGPGGAFVPNANAPFHLYTGDLSGLPAIAAGVESLPADARGLVLIEILHAEDADLPISAPAGVEVQWLLNNDYGDPTFLANAVEELDWIEGTQVFAHGERESIKALRRVFRDREVPRADLSISAYWALGRAEDEFQAEKQLPVGKID